jgi:hypothetical protein
LAVIMNHTRFALLMLALIALLLIGVGYERYQACQKKGGSYCKIGPGKRGPFLRPALPH